MAYCTIAHIHQIDIQILSFRMIFVTSEDVNIAPDGFPDGSILGPI